MKIFLIDKYNKNLDLANGIMACGEENVEIKEGQNFRVCKNDFLIVTDDVDIDNISKTAKLIVLTRNKKPQFYWKLINNYNCIDIIDDAIDRNYIINRISKKIHENIL